MSNLLAFYLGMGTVMLVMLTLITLSDGESILDMWESEWGSKLKLEGKLFANAIASAFWPVILGFVALLIAALVVWTAVRVAVFGPIQIAKALRGRSE